MVSESPAGRSPSLSLSGDRMGYNPAYPDLIEAHRNAEMEDISIDAPQAHEVRLHREAHDGILIARERDAAIDARDARRMAGGRPPRRTGDMAPIETAAAFYSLPPREGPWPYDMRDVRLHRAGGPDPRSRLPSEESSLLSAVRDRLSSSDSMDLRRDRTRSRSRPRSRRTERPSRSTARALRSLSARRPRRVPTGTRIVRPKPPDDAKGEDGARSRTRSPSSHDL